MDPTMTLIEALEALAHGESEDAQMHLENLAEWLAKGGAVPAVKITRLPGESRHAFALVGPDWNV